MPAAHNLRLQIEATLADRVPGALTPSPKSVPRGIASGIKGVDEALESGLACGVITELVGPECSGRTSLALAYLAAIVGAENVCAWVDVADALCPESVAASGIDLERLLWVRCGAGQESPSRTDVAKLDESPTHPEAISTSQPRHVGGGSPHPRSEGRNMPQAISAMLKAHGGIYDRQLRREKRSIGTPGAPNRPLTKPLGEREEQVNSDRLPPRRGENLAIAPRCAEPQPQRVAQVSAATPMLQERLAGQSRPRTGARGNPWQAIDQAIRTTDLLLQGGGISVIVLDLGSTPAEIAWRIPLATWFRYRAACERTRTSLLLLTQHPCSRSSAELVVRLKAGSMEAQSKVMTGIRYHLETERNRSRERATGVIPIRKSPQPDRSSLRQSGQWTNEAAWVQTK